MKKPLRVLFVEDSPLDADLAIREICNGGFEPDCLRVETQEAFKVAVDSRDWDVIISDLSLPQYNGLIALADARETKKDVPFILLTGSVGETVAVSAMRAGAQDFILKGNLSRLPAVIEREVGEARIRAERRRIREQLVISERMATAGTLAAGVAHEINNPLAIAVANLDFMTTVLTRLPSEARSFAPNVLEQRPSEWAAWLEERLAVMEEPLSDLREAMGRIRDIIRDVRLFSRTNDDQVGPVDVRRVVESAIRMAWNEIRHRAQLVREYGDVPMVEASEARLAQVVLNLVVNAAQAIPEGHAEKNEIRIVLKAIEGSRVLIEVRDTGSGIDEADKARVFDPFFTTKPVAIGTGLGLAICHRIVTDLNGTIDVESEVGQGTLFRVTLPSAGSQEEDAGPSILPPPSRRGRILFVDDEAVFGKTVKRSLAAYHDVVPVTTVREALAMIARGDRFDIVISDVAMPEMTGADLHDELVRSAPEQARRMIFATGGAFTAKTREFLDRVPNPRIDKPFEVTNLLAIISGLLRWS